jgi:hypothetical protein
MKLRLLPHVFSTLSLPQLIYLSYRWTSFSIVCFQKFILFYGHHVTAVTSITCSQKFVPVLSPPCHNCYLNYLFPEVCACFIDSMSQLLPQLPVCRSLCLFFRHHVTTVTSITCFQTFVPVLSPPCHNCVLTWVDLKGSKRL